MATAAAVCPAPMKATSEGVWQGDNPLEYALPLIILQICVVVTVSRGLAFLLRPLRQPRVIAEIIGGILLGPSALGRSQAFRDAVFPARSLTVLDTLANIGLLFFLFLVGLELDFASLRRTGRNALAIAIAGISVPFTLGVGVSVALRNSVAKGAPSGPFLVFMGVALSITAFPVLARILAELKLLTTDLGRTAMSAAAVNDVAAWVLLALAIALSGTGSPIVSLYVLLCGAAFVTLAVLLLRPVLNYMAQRSPDGEPVKEPYICATLVIVLAAGFMTDLIGIHALFGAFVVGVIVPKEGPYASALLEKTEDLVSALFLPLYFVSSGLKTNVATISGGLSWALLVLVIATACIGKVGGTLAAAFVARVPPREGLALGFLMNTKGLVELIVLNIGLQRKVLNEETFAILVLMALFTTFITTPIVIAVYRPARSAAPYKHRTVARASADAESELRLLACFHGYRGIPSVINLIEASRGTRRRPLVVYAMHLVELSERSSSISMVLRARRNGLPFAKRGNNTSEIIVAFEAYQRLSAVSVKPMTAISDIDTMHDDIIASAMRKRAALIILPFHKVLQPDGALSSMGNGGYHGVNARVLARAPCSVAVLIDRGLGGAAQVAAQEVSFSATVLFFGGPDDREALAYAARMAEHPGISLTVARFVLPSTTATDAERADDEAAIKESLAHSSATYQEVAIESPGSMASVLKETCRGRGLVIVGRSPPTAAIVEHSDCPELGPVGGYLATQEFSTTASVLVVQAYDPKYDDSQVVNGDAEAGSVTEGAVVPVQSPAYNIAAA